MRWLFLIGLLALSCSDESVTSTSGSEGESEGESESESEGESEGAVVPLEGVWQLDRDEYIGGTCEGLDGGYFPDSDYRLEHGEDGEIRLYYTRSDTPIHTCSREKDEYLCPQVMIGGTSCEKWDVELRVAFDSPASGVAVATWYFDVWNDDPNICGDGYGDINPCTVIEKLSLTLSGN